jgi:hypothetical protein
MYVKKFIVLGFEPTKTWNSPPRLPDQSGQIECLVLALSIDRSWITVKSQNTVHFN